MNTDPFSPANYELPACEACDGKRFVPCGACKTLSEEERARCEECHGQSPCARCNGTGLEPLHTTDPGEPLPPDPMIFPDPPGW